MIICPSCGSHVEGDLCLGCPSCGARAVGPPLAKPEHELPSYGRAAIAFASGVIMSLGFLISTVAALIESKGLTLRFWMVRFWNVVAAGETAAWRLKWTMVPISIAVLWSGRRIIRSLNGEPHRFIGLRAARIGFVNAATVTVMMAALIGITIPERLRQRQYAIEAAIYARGYRLELALLDYRELHGTLPTEKESFVKELRTLPDPDGSIAEALRFVDPNGYQATTEPLAATKGKPLVQRGSALRGAAARTNIDPPPVPFTSYKLRLLSEHRLFGGDDDFIMLDGIITKDTEGSSSSVLTRRGAP